MDMNRREALIRMALLIGASTVGLRLQSAEPAAKPGEGGVTWDTGDLALLDEIGDTIIPETDVPGAKAAGIGAFIAMMLRDCYSSQEQAVVHEGVANLAKTFETRFGVPFIRGKAEDRTAFLNELDREQKHATAERHAGPHYFRVLKELTVLGYFSSEIGGTKALQYVEVPGGFNGSAPYKKGDRSWWFA